MLRKFDNTAQLTVFDHGNDRTQEKIFGDWGCPVRDTPDFIVDFFTNLTHAALSVL